MTTPAGFVTPLGAYQQLVVSLEGEHDTGVMVAGTAPGFIRTETTLTLTDKALRDAILSLDAALDPTTHRALRFFEYLKAQPFSRIEYR